MAPEYINNNLHIAGEARAAKYVVTGGTASQFLKADGSLDGSSYVTAAALSGYATQGWVGSNFVPATYARTNFASARLAVVPGVGISNAPTLGSPATSSLFLAGDNGLWGTYFGHNSSSGALWMQVQRNDGNGAAYDMDLNPAGGAVRANGYPVWHQGTLPRPYRVDYGAGISGDSDPRVNAAWFDYSWGGTGYAGVAASFGGLSDNYRLEIFGQYNGVGDKIGARTRNGDNNTWNPACWLWHSGNFNPADYATQSWSANAFIPKTHPAFGITASNAADIGSYRGYSDNRTIQPAHLATRQLQFGFTSYNNSGAGDWADFLHFGGYQDPSGGRQNLIVFNKNNFGIRQYQASAQGVAPYSSFVDFWHTGNDGAESGLDADLLDGMDSSRFVFGTNELASLDSDGSSAGWMPVKSGFYRGNGKNDYGALAIWCAHPNAGGGQYSAGILFNYGGTDAYITGRDGDNKKAANRRIWLSTDFTQQNVNSWNTAYGWGNHASANYAAQSWVSQNFTTNTVAANFLKKNARNVTDSKFSIESTELKDCGKISFFSGAYPAMSWGDTSSGEASMMHMSDEQMVYLDNCAIGQNNPSLFNYFNGFVAVYNGMSAKGKVYLHNTVQQTNEAQISVAIGNPDTGFNWEGNGSIGYYSGGQRKYYLNDVWHSGNLPASAVAAIGSLNNTFVRLDDPRISSPAYAGLDTNTPNHYAFPVLNQHKSVVLDGFPGRQNAFVVSLPPPDVDTVGMRVDVYHTRNDSAFYPLRVEVADRGGNILDTLFNDQLSGYKLELIAMGKNWLVKKIKTED